jgi:hypothetical protein
MVTNILKETAASIYRVRVEQERTDNMEAADILLLHEN